MTETLSILLVEDDRHIALALQIRLRAAGYRVMLAGGAAEALSVVNTEVPNVAVMDVNLPDGDGIELMQNFAALKHDSPILPIIMTASRKPGLREHAMAHGAFAFLEKPFSSAVLLEAVACRGRPSAAC